MCEREVSEWIWEAFLRRDIAEKFASSHKILTKPEDISRKHKDEIFYN